MKKEFKYRLARLRDSIDSVLEHDCLCCDFLPHLFSVFTYMWGKNVDDLVNHNSTQRRGTMSIY